MYRYLNLLLLLELCSQYKAEASSCGYSKGSDGLYYNFYHKNVDWSTAKATCESEDAHLAIISSPATFEYIKNTYSFHMGGIWIGARDMNSKNDWRWIDGRPVQKTYWQTGEPNNWQGVQEDCVMINYYHGPGRFHDAPCDWTGPKFLCQKEHRECVKEEGYCVANGRDVNTTRLDNVSADGCLQKCLVFPNATGCSVVQEHNVTEEYGCYVTTQNVTGGNGDDKHSCWIISKCEGTGSLVPPPQPEPTSCKPYHCYPNRAQMGYDISYKKANTLDACSQHCCQMQHCQCIGFDWVQESNACWLSQTPRSRVPTTKTKGVFSCEFKDVPVGYKKGYLGSFFKLYPNEVDWHTAKLKCLEDGAQLVMDDFIEKHNYLVQTYHGQAYWIGIRNLKKGGGWTYGNARRVLTTFWDGGQPDSNVREEACVVMWHDGRWLDESCSESRSYICEIQGVTMPTDGKEDDDKKKKDKNNNVIIIIVLVVLSNVVTFALWRIYTHHRIRVRRRAATAPSPVHSQHQGISNEAMSHNVNETVNPPPVPKPTVVSGVAVLPAPPQYHVLFPTNNGLPDELPPPPSYYSVMPANYSGYTGNSNM